MLGDKDLLAVPFGDKTSFLGEIEETSKFQWKLRIFGASGTERTRNKEPKKDDKKAGKID